MRDFLSLNKFTKQGKIGQGAFGKVFKVRENKTGNIFTAKISIKKLNEFEKENFKNIKRKISILSQLNHPSVLKFIGYSPYDFNHQNYPVIMTEYSSNCSKMI
mgnify:CR=1 FL=1